MSSQTLDRDWYKLALSLQAAAKPNGRRSPVVIKATIFADERGRVLGYAKDTDRVEPARDNKLVALARGDGDIGSAIADSFSD